MPRKFSAHDKETFQRVFLSFPWLPLSELSAVMQTLAQVWALPEKWADFNKATAHRWVEDGGWRDQVKALDRLVDDHEALPCDDEIDDQIMRRNLHVLERLYNKLTGEVGDAQHVTRHYIELQREIRNHVAARRSIPLTPVQLIDLFIRAGLFAAGQHFDQDKAKEFLITAFSQARQIAPMGSYAESKQTQGRA